MAEETTVEKLTEERRELDVRIREQKVLAHQREHLLPALELKEERLIVQIADLEHERDEDAGEGQGRAGVVDEHELEEEQVAQPHVGPQRLGQDIHAQVQRARYLLEYGLYFARKAGPALIH